MFALWYLSLAVDELRKHFGWTFFDIFYKTNKTDTHALDNKPDNVATTKPAEPDQPSVSNPAPAVPPKVNPTPAPAPAPKPAPVAAPAPAPVAKPQTPPAPKLAAEVEPPKPVAAPVVPKPAPAKTKPITPPSSPKTAQQNVNDAMDKKLMKASKAKENGENLKNNLKMATMDFLSGEANAQAPSKR